MYKSLYYLYLVHVMDFIYNFCFALLYIDKYNFRQKTNFA